MKNKILIIVFSLFLNFVYGQIEQINEMKKLYTKSDSLKKLNKPFIISEEFKLTLVELEKEHPAKFFEKFNEYLVKDNYNECAFLYHLGVLRYSYFNSTNKKYEASGDGALFASLKYMTGEVISIYLKNDIDKYIEILNLVDDYVEKNDYAFHSKKINIKKYKELEYDDLVTNLITNRTKFSEEWTTERKEMLENLNKSIEEYNNLSEEEKNNLNKN
jgi:hypothetical protein